MRSSHFHCPTQTGYLTSLNVVIRFPLRNRLSQQGELLRSAPSLNIVIRLLLRNRSPQKSKLLRSAITLFVHDHLLLSEQEHLVDGSLHLEQAICLTRLSRDRTTDGMSKRFKLGMDHLRHRHTTGVRCKRDPHEMHGDGLHLDDVLHGQREIASIVSEHPSEESPFSDLPQSILRREHQRRQVAECSSDLLGSLHDLGAVRSLREARCPWNHRASAVRTRHGTKPPGTHINPRSDAVRSTSAAETASEGPSWEGPSRTVERQRTDDDVVPSVELPAEQLDLAVHRVNGRMRTLNPLFARRRGRQHTAPASTQRPGRAPRRASRSAACEDGASQRPRGSCGLRSWVQSRRTSESSRRAGSRTRTGWRGPSTPRPDGRPRRWRRGGPRALERRVRRHRPGERPRCWHRCPTSLWRSGRSRGLPPDGAPRAMADATASIWSHTVQQDQIVMRRWTRFQTQSLESRGEDVRRALQRSEDGKRRRPRIVPLLGLTPTRGWSRCSAPRWR